ncbi:hypothetical protein ACMFMG_011485 [Clarireedia jacksonii]
MAFSPPHNVYVSKDNGAVQDLSLLGVINHYRGAKLSDGLYDELLHQGKVDQGLQVPDHSGPYNDHGMSDYLQDNFVASVKLKGSVDMNVITVCGLRAQLSANQPKTTCQQCQSTIYHQSTIQKSPLLRPLHHLQESLDSRFCKIGKPSRFFTVGRVFMTLWTEPTGSKYTNNGQITKAWLNTNAYSEIRRFVVIREGKGYSLCSPVHTYGGQGTLKPRLDAEEHAAIYVKGTEPVIREEEKMTVEPFPVIVEDNANNDCEAQVLHPMSRINLGKIYTVEHYSRVLKIGRIDPGHLMRLRQCAGLNTSNSTNQPLNNDGIGQIDSLTKGVTAALNLSKAAQTSVGGDECTQKQNSIKLDLKNLPDDEKSTSQQGQTKNNTQRHLRPKSQLQGDAKPFESSQFSAPSTSTVPLPEPYAQHPNTNTLTLPLPESYTQYPNSDTPGKRRAEL